MPPKISNNNTPKTPSLFTAIQVTYKEKQLTLNAHSLMSFLMQNDELLLDPKQPITSLPPGNASPANWISLDPTLKEITLAGHTITINEHTYTSLKSSPPPPDFDVETEVLDILEDLILRFYNHTKKNSHPPEPTKMVKSFLDLWGKFTQSQVNQAVPNSATDNASYFKFGDVTKETYGLQNHTMAELIKAIQSQAFIKDLAKNLEEKIKQIFDNLANRFKKNDIKQFFNHFRAAVENTIKGAALQSFIQRAQQDTFELNDFIDNTLENLGKKPTRKLKNIITMHCYAAAKKMIPIFESAQKARLLENINDRELILEMRRILQNPTHASYQFLPTLTVTLFFSELKRRKHKDIMIATLSLFDLIESGEKIPGTQEYYNFHNLLINANSNSFVTSYGEEYEDNNFKKSIGQAPASHAGSFKKEMAHRAKYFQNKNIIRLINIKNDITPGDIGCFFIGQEIEKAKTDFKKNGNKKEDEENLKLLKTEGNRLTNYAKHEEGEMKKHKEDLNKNPQLFLVEQKIAHLIFHWLSIKLKNFRPTPLQSPLSSKGFNAEEEASSITDLLNKIILPLLKDRLAQFDCMLPKYAENTIDSTLHQVSNVLTSLENTLKNIEDHDDASVDDKEEDNTDAIIVDTDEKDHDNTIVNDNDEESLPSPILSTKGNSSPMQPCSPLQTSATLSPALRMYGSSSQQKIDRWTENTKNIETRTDLKKVEL